MVVIQCHSYSNVKVLKIFIFIIPYYICNTFTPQIKENRVYISHVAYLPLSENELMRNGGCI